MSKLLHAQQRGIERVGKFLTEHDLSLMVAEIEEGPSKLYRVNKGGRTTHLVDCPTAGRHLLVVYDPAAQTQIVTILPDEHFQKWMPYRKISGLRKRGTLREIDADWIEDEANSEDVDIPEPLPASNDAMAEALRKAFQEAGMSMPEKDISA